MKENNNNYGSIEVHQQSLEDGEMSPPPLKHSGRKFRFYLCAAAGALAALVLLVAVNNRYFSSLFDHENLSPGGSATQHESEHGGVTADQKKKPYSSIPRFYNEQLVDHFDKSNNAVWSHRYYAKRNHWRGPGHPIFLVVGGEGGNEVGMFYPFIERVLAAHFGAYVLHPEHRFYGASQPLPYNASVPELIQLLTPGQAMADMLQLANHFRRELGCSMQRSSPKYCPLMTAGGSYPGFLAAMMRLVYPDRVEVAYASSAPLKLYSQEASPWGYYDALTQAADRASPGCAKAVKTTLVDFDSILGQTEDFETLAEERLNICPGSIPAYINNSALFSQELVQIIETTFADANMIGNYPPSDKTWFSQLCHVFQNETAKDSLEKLTNFWLNLEIRDKTKDCFAMDEQMSDGEKATISSADWSGLGPGTDGRMWDFQCCYSLVPAMGFSKHSMFPYRKWTYEWVTQHCVDRFGVVGDPFGMVEQWHFDDLVGQGASRIIFTNGGNDMWAAGSYTHNLSDSIVAINMPNGGHHSEVYALVNDTADVKAAQHQIKALLEGWFNDMKKGYYRG